jgi:hypothetical protein
MDPLRRRPFLAFDDRAAPMEAERVRHSIDVKAEEENRITFHRFHCNKQIDLVNLKIQTFRTSEPDASVLADRHGTTIWNHLIKVPDFQL